MDTKSNTLQSILAKIQGLGFHIQTHDFDRPWGGFLVIDPVDTKKFILQFYPELADELTATTLPLSPKILCVAPEQRLS